MKILFVEDNIPDIDLIKAVLAGEDCELEFARSFKESLELKASFEPDLIALDVSLPDSSPLQTVRNIKQLKDNCALVILTGDESGETIFKATAAGADDYILKNVFKNGSHLFERLMKAWIGWKSKAHTQTSPLSSVAMKQASIPVAEVILLLQNQNADQSQWKDFVYGQFNDIKETLVAHNTINDAKHKANIEKLDSIEKQVIHTNGSVQTLKAEVKILQEKDKLETDEKIKRAIGDQAVIDLKERKIFIPKIKLSARQWTAIGVVASFLGYPVLSAWAISIWHVLGHIFHVLFG